MKSVTPPRLASWLLCHQVGGYQAESLVGDLTEEYAQGRSEGWFWRQVLSAVARSYLRVFRVYGLRFLGAMAAGWGVFLLAIALLGPIGTIAQSALSAFGANWPAQRLQTLSVLFSVAWVIFGSCIDFVVGRLVVRIYRSHPRLIVNIFALTILLYMLPSIYGHLIIAVDDSRGVPALAQQLFFTFLWMSSAWFGGLWQIRADAKRTKG